MRAALRHAFSFSVRSNILLYFYAVYSGLAYINVLTYHFQNGANISRKFVKCKWIWMSISGENNMQWYMASKLLLTIWDPLALHMKLKYECDWSICGEINTLLPHTPENTKLIFHWHTAYDPAISNLLPNRNMELICISPLRFTIFCFTTT